MTPAIYIEDLIKRFPKTGGYKDILTFWRRPYVTALDNASLEVPRGGVFGLLGPNGAGKTTLLKILAGLVLADEGVVEVNGVDLRTDPQAAKGHLMYVSPEERSFNWRVSGRDSLKFYATLYNLPRQQVDRKVAEVLAIVSLEDAADERVSQYSSGMRQRLSIARGLLAEPEILLLDEPTRSLDPLGARQIWKFVKEELVAQQGVSVVVATHNMEEATTICDRVAILYRGKVRACDTVTAISARLGGQSRYIISLTKATSDGIDQLQGLAGVLSVLMAPPNGHEYRTLELVLTEPGRNVPAVLEHLVKSGAGVMEVTEVKSSLGDAIADLAKESQ